MNDAAQDPKDILRRTAGIINARFEWRELYNGIINSKIVRYEDNALFKKIIHNLLETGNYVSHCSEQKILYRARAISFNWEEMVNSGVQLVNGNLTGYNETNSKEPPLNVSGQGRNNIPGQSYLYLADSEYIACCEIKQTHKFPISLARFKIKKDLKILDLTHWNTETEYYEVRDGIFVSMREAIYLLVRQMSDPVYTNSEYKITQLFSDYIRKAGFDGISYRSSFGNGLNYTIFNCFRSNVEFLDSRLIYFYRAVYDFIDVNTGKLIAHALYPWEDVSDEKIAKIASDFKDDISRTLHVLPLRDR